MLTDRNLVSDPARVLAGIIAVSDPEVAGMTVMVAEVGRVLQDNDSPVPSFVGAIRDSGRLRDEVSTVDNAETILGWVAMILGLETARRGDHRALRVPRRRRSVVAAVRAREPADAARRTAAGIARDAVVVTVCTLLSRVTGFARVLVAAAVLGTGLLGDTYHAANIVPNLLFELVAGGVLQAVLVPTFVAARREGGDEELGRTAGALVAALSAVLAIIVVIGMVAAPLLARALTSLEDDPAIADDKLSVMSPMLLVFVPQVMFYGIGMVATAALAARHRFAAAALAPAVNNVVVIACYLLYRASRGAVPPSLDLDPLAVRTAGRWHDVGGGRLHRCPGHRPVGSARALAAHLAAAPSGDRRASLVGRMGDVVGRRHAGADRCGRRAGLRRGGRGGGVHAGVRVLRAAPRAGRGAGRDDAGTAGGRDLAERRPSTRPAR